MEQADFPGDRLRSVGSWLSANSDAERTSSAWTGSIRPFIASAKARRTSRPSAHRPEAR